ncbi:MAG: exonuclease domain-containing protein [Xanthomonadales bacterium]
MFRKWRYRSRCRRLAAACTQAVLARYLDTCACTRAGHIRNSPLIAADLELTGLDANSNQIIAIGWTLVDNGRIRFGSNRHLLVTAQQSVGSSAAIHELVDSDVARGVELNAALEELFEAARGRIWVFHHAALDVAFLRKACRKWAGVAPPFPVLDTMQIELARRKRRDQHVQEGDLQLGRLRSKYQLPRYTAHDALIDAVATAELLLAMAARLDRKAPLPLASHVRIF